jgi:hypothetical protein
MASILDNALLVGKESTYGTAASLTRAYEGKVDSWKRSQDFLTSQGFRGGLHTQMSTRSVPVNLGGSGTIDVDVQPTGMGLLFQSMLGAVTGPTQQASTTAYKSTFTSTSAGPVDSWTVQMQRVDIGGTVRSFTHKGSVMTGWKLSQPVDGMFSSEFMFDFQDVATDVSAGTPTYVSSLPYTWQQCSATWDGDAITLESWDLEADLGFKTDRYRLSSVLKQRPIRASVPTFTGNMQMDLDGLDQYNAFTAGTIAPLVVTWTGSNIASTYDFQVKVTLAAVQFQGDSPQVSLDDLPKQSLPYKVLYNGTDPAVKIEYTSTDTAL